MTIGNDTVYIYEASDDKFEHKSKNSLLGLKSVAETPIYILQLRALYTVALLP